MFRLIKIENSGVNVPEPVLLKKDTATKIAIGTALVINEGIAVMCGSAAKPEYISYENAPAENDTVLCYRVNSNMLFEVAVTAEPTSLTVGSKVTLAADEDGCMSLVSATAGGAAEVADLCSAKLAGDKITVRF